MQRWQSLTTSSPWDTLPNVFFQMVACLSHFCHVSVIWQETTRFNKDRGSKWYIHHDSRTNDSREIKQTVNTQLFLLFVWNTVADNGSRSRNLGIYIAVTLKTKFKRHLPGEFHDCSWVFWFRHCSRKDARRVEERKKEKKENESRFSPFSGSSL